MHPHPFHPLTDAEFALLSRHLPSPDHTRGRPPADRRRTLNAIFWVACSSGPWKDLPAEYGRADTAHRQLRRWAATGHMDLLLTLVANRDRRKDRLWNRLAWRICRAWRRVSRLVGLGSLLLAKRLGLRPALPAAPRYLPDPNLSETAQALVRRAFENPWAQVVGTFAALAKMMRLAGGNRRRWRLR
ncbi:transposase [Neoroseomonas oryzicola]|uniref:Transposase n=1 Tax=Neoroseomonas oryzicola TaxID=535904 RepID=A0A9X9WMJ2_9PROT|nr:transposase [Neoroseomonas oryzicola]MBR0661552.1 transposase [Neoroseomonas oryzicola]NKE18390.1 transposase [Neoroseomonas oryzicola]